MSIVRAVIKCLPRSWRKMILKVGTSLFVKLKNAAEAQRHAAYRAKYDIHPSFRFNGEGVVLYGGGKIILGQRSYIGRFSSVQATKGNQVIIGANVRISHFVKIYTENLVPDQNLKGDGPFERRTGSVTIGDGCWIGASVFIREGIRIGEDTVVGANSVVTKDLPPHSIAAGYPARVIRYKKNLNVG